jgi:hypothetical protein
MDAGVALSSEVAPLLRRQVGNRCSSTTCPGANLP